MGCCFTKIFSDLFGRKEIQIVMVGLGYAGKTTIIYRLQLREDVPPLSVTVGWIPETVRYKNNSLMVLDVGGQFKTWEIAKTFFGCMPGLIYVVDSTDRDRIVEAKNDLHMWLEQLKDTVVLVFANKQDCANAMSPAEITDKLDLHSIQQQHWHVQGSCATFGQGLYEGMDWLLDHIANKT